MIGQRKLQNRLEKLNLANLPHSNILLGKFGCGKHTFLKMISDKLNVDIINLSDNFKFDTLSEIMVNPQLGFYQIDCDTLKERDYNAILKFIEEPVENVYIFLICNNKSSLLPTILNRCQIWEFETYSIEELSKFSTDKLVLSICDTPGEIMSIKDFGISDIYDFCKLIVDKISIASIPNMLTLSNRIAFKSEKNKFNLNIVLKCIEKVLLDAYCSTSYSKYRIAFITSKEYRNKLSQYNLNAQMIFERYLLELKGILSNEN